MKNIIPLILLSTIVLSGCMFPVKDLEKTGEQKNSSTLSRSEERVETGSHTENSTSTGIIEQSSGISGISSQNIGTSGATADGSEADTAIEESLKEIDILIGN